MIFCYVSGTFGAIIRFYSQLSSLKKQTILYLYKIKHRKKKSPPCHSIKLETLKPRNSPPSIKSENPTKKPYKEPVLPCFSMVFLSAIFAVFCMFFSSFPVLFCWCYLPFFYRGNHSGGSASGDGGTPATRGNTTSHHKGKTSQCI